MTRHTTPPDSTVPPAGPPPAGAAGETVPEPSPARGAHASFVDAQYEAVYRWFWWLTRCPELAADLTQDTFAAYWVSLDRIAPRHPRVWLFRIARNRWRRWLRARRTVAALDPNDIVNTSDPGSAALAGETGARVREAVAALAPIYREALTLRVGCDLGYAEVARILGIPTPLARWRVHQARLRLRHRLEAASTPTGDST